MQKKKTVAKRKRREIIGLICIATGIFLFASMFLSSTGLIGGLIKPVMYGCFGISAYLMPIYLMGFGLAFILKDKKKINKIKVSVVLAFSLAIFALCHMFVVNSIDTNSYLDFIISSYSMGMEVKGCGAFISLIVYPVWRLTGFVGSIIIYMCSILILSILYTNLSLKKVGDKVGRNVKKQYNTTKDFLEVKKDALKTSMENRRAKLYTKEMEFGQSQESDEELSDSNVEVEKNEIVERTSKLPFLSFEPTVKEEPKEEIVDISDFEEVVEVEPTKPEVVQVEKPVEQEEPKKMDEFFAEYGKKAHDPKNISVNDVSTYKPIFKSQDAGFLTLLKQPDTSKKGQNKDELEYKANVLEETLESFNVSAKVVNITCGPAVTRYEIQPAHGVKISKITNLVNDIKMALAAKDLRIEAPIPGKNAVGVEVPNDNVRTVYLREVLETTEFTKHKSKLAFALGIDIDGNSIVADLEKMPHLLIAGTTGSGKSVCINNLILSFLYNASPEEVKMIMVDPKMVELASYNDLPHMLIPVVTDCNRAASALRWALNEMEKRYLEFSRLGVRQLATYNEAVEEDKQKPRIVVIVDELADLMMVAAQEVEEIICRIAQKGRAAGIHLVLATQRPSVNVITGIIKANVPSRIAFQVYSQVDSRTILDMSGAERLLGRGDMLYHPNGAGVPTRCQGAFVSEEEVKEITEYIKAQSDCEYNEDILKEIEKVTKGNAGAFDGEEGSDYDELLPDAVKVFLNKKEASISLLQRKMRIGYARAARIVDQMEDMGIVSPPDGSKRREVLITYDDFDRMFNGEDM